MPEQKIAIIIGAGPAGLTAAYELLQKTDIKPVIFEIDDCVGGISRTVNYKGNRIDIGGHRFFSKSDRVMNWWQNILPVQALEDSRTDKIEINYQNKRREIEIPTKGHDPDKEDKLMLVRSRLSRIYYLRRFFNYPVDLSLTTIRNLGLLRMVKIGFSYIKARLFPIKKENSLEDFFINRFGQELYKTFFKDYTEKVWGVDCSEISAEWGAQRIKGLSISKAILHALKSLKSKSQTISQKEIETSLIQRFLYPKFGPGQMWETVAELVKAKGGEIYLKHQVNSLDLFNDHINQVKVKDLVSGDEKQVKGSYFFSTMPVKELINSLEPDVPKEVKEIADNLVYRDFITVGLLLNKLKVKNNTKIKTKNDLIPDNWIYIQEPEVKLGRVQVFNNWSPYMISDPNKVWIGLEYFVNQGDKLWNSEDNKLKDLAIKELDKIDFIEPNNVLDSVIIRMPKTYPAYFGSYNSFDVIRKFVDKIDNLFLIGRNGMHRYNNMDHSMLTAMVAVENITKGIKSKDNIWQVNAEKDYHETK